MAPVAATVGSGVPWDWFRDAVFGSTARRPKVQPSVDLPRFAGGRDANPRHYFFKLQGYFDTYNIVHADDQARLVALSLEGEALDLFLSLSPAQQGNMRELEDIFEVHFRPVAQGYLGVSEFLKLEKGPRETVSEFYLRVRKYADRQKITPDIVKVAFMQGLPIEYQKYLVLRKDLVALDDLYKASLNFEQASVLDAR